MYDTRALRFRAHDDDIHMHIAHMWYMHADDPDEVASSLHEIVYFCYISIYFEMMIKRNKFKIKIKKSIFKYISNFMFCIIIIYKKLKFYSVFSGIPTSMNESRRAHLSIINIWIQ